MCPAWTASAARSAAAAAIAARSCPAQLDSQVCGLIGDARGTCKGLKRHCTCCGNL